MENIETHRKKLDELDDVIIAYLLERFEVVNEIGKIKRMHNIEVFQSEREEAIFDGIKDRCRGYDYVESIIAIYKTIMDESKALQIY